MDQSRFDVVSRWFASGDTRRALLAKIGAVGVGATLATVVGGFTPIDTEAAAKKKCKKQCKRRFDQANQRAKKRKCIKRCTKQRACTTSADCSAGQVCTANNTCAPIVGCANDSQCGAGRTCTGGQCVDAGSGCTTAADCGLAQTCAGGVCTTPIGTEGCDADGECSSNTDICVPVLDICLPDLGACTAGACPSGQTCILDVCVPGTGGSCSILGTACDSADDCCGNLLCVQVGPLGANICVGL